MAINTLNNFVKPRFVDTTTRNVINSLSGNFRNDNMVNRATDELANWDLINGERYQEPSINYRHTYRARDGDFTGNSINAQNELRRMRNFETNPHTQNFLEKHMEGMTMDDMMQEYMMEK